eukprot:g16673.t1
MATEALAAYTAGKYGEALSHLSNLSVAANSNDTNPSSSSSSAADTATNEFRTQHNRALCEHAARGFTDPATLEATLRSIQSRLVGSRGSGASNGSDAEAEDSDDVSAGATPEAGAARRSSRAVTGALVVGASGGARAAAQAAAGLADLDADASVLLYNLSALRFQQKQYGAAQAVLEWLFLHIEPLDDSLAIHICLLLLDVLCHSARGNLHTEDNLRRFSAQTAAVLAFLERPHALNSAGGGGDSGAGGDSGRQQAQDDSGSGDSAEQTEFAFRLHLYKAKVLLLQEQTKTSKKEIKSALEIFQRELRGTGSDSTASGGGGAGESQQQQPGTFAPVPPPGVQNMAALYLKANLEHLRDNHRKALKLLASCHGFQGAEEYSGPGEAVGPPYFNNMGCLHHKLGRHHVALHYFQKALEALGKGARAKGAGGESSGGEAAAAAGRGGGKDGHVSPAPTCEVLYNTGLQLLLTQKPEQALRCFERAALLFHNRPYLWLRMAECSITHHRLRTNTANNGGGGVGGRASSSFTTAKGLSSSAPSAEAGGADGADAAGGGRGPLPWMHVGKGQHRRVLLPRGSSSSPSSASAAAPSAPPFAAGGAGAGAGAGAGGSGRGDGAIVLDDDNGGGTSETSNGSAATASAAAAAAAAGGGKGGRSAAAAGGGCSLAHASRCLHNVLYLCSARAQGAKEAAASGAAGLLGGQPSVLGMSPRLVAKGLSAGSGGGSSSTKGGEGGGGSDSGSNSADGGGGGVAEESGRGMVGEELYQVALADLAFVHLGLNDPVSALAFAERLLETKPSAVGSHLAHLYAAEALCLLGRPAEALDHLKPVTETGCTTAAAAAAAATAATDVWSSPSAASAAAAAAAAAASTTPTAASQRPNASAAGAGAGGGAAAAAAASGGAGGVAGSLLSTKAADEARASLHANLAVVHALQGSLAQAERCARMAMGICPGSAAVLRTAVYVLVRQGNIAEALQVLKEGRLSHK